MVPGELGFTGGDALVDTTSGDFEGFEHHGVEGQNPATTRKSKKKYTANVLDSTTQQFQAIIQLLQLVDSLVANSRNEKPEDQHLNKKLSDGTSHKAFDYVDAITNLMVRNGEVAAAVACGDRHENGIISISSPNQTSFNEKAQVRPQYTSYV